MTNPTESPIAFVTIGASHDPKPFFVGVETTPTRTQPGTLQMTLRFATFKEAQKAYKAHVASGELLKMRAAA